MFRSNRFRVKREGVREGKQWGVLFKNMSGMFLNALEKDESVDNASGVLEKFKKFSSQSKLQMQENEGMIKALASIICLLTAFEQFKGPILAYWFET